MVSQQNIRFRQQLSQVSHVVPPVATRAQACCDVSLRMPGYAAGSTYDKCRRRKCWPQRSPADPRHWWPQWDWRLRFSWVLGGKKHEHTSSMKRLKWRMRFTVLMLVLTWHHLALAADANILWNISQKHCSCIAKFGGTWPGSSSAVSVHEASIYTNRIIWRFGFIQPGSMWCNNLSGIKGQGNQSSQVVPPVPMQLDTNSLDFNVCKIDIQNLKCYLYGMSMWTMGKINLLENFDLLSSNKLGNGNHRQNFCVILDHSISMPSTPPNQKLAISGEKNGWISSVLGCFGYIKGIKLKSCTFSLYPFVLQVLPGNLTSMSPICVYFCQHFSKAPFTGTQGAPCCALCQTQAQR